MRFLFRRIWDWVCGRRLRQLRTSYVVELPEELDHRLLYLVGENGYLWFAAMLCPCGCGDTLHMSLDTSARPSWRISIHRDGSATLYPSIWRRVGCASHFFLRRGRIRWCDD